MTYDDHLESIAALPPVETPCDECAEPTDPTRMIKAFGLILCQHCIQKYNQVENADGSPFILRIWEYKTVRGTTISREYPFNDLYEAMEFGLCWGGILYNVSGSVIYDYNKLPF